VRQVALFVLEEPVGHDPRIARVDALRTQLERHEYVCAAPKSGYDAALLRLDSKLDTVFFVPPKIRTASSKEKIVLLSSWSAVRSEAVDRPRVFILFII
jgi:hypothetical protein